MRARREQLERILDHAAQREIGQRELQAARLDLGEVQDVVDDFQQALARAIDRLGEAPLFVGQRGAQQQLGHAQDAVHRRADLMAHIGHELALGLAGGLGQVAGTLQFERVAALVGHVGHQAIDAHLAIGQAAGAGAVAQPAHALVGVLDAQGDVGRLEAGFLVLLQHEERAVFFDHHVFQAVGAAQDGFFADAPEVLRAGAQVQVVLPARRGDVDAVLHRLDELPVAQLGFFKIGLRAAGAGDVAGQRDQQARGAVGVAQCEVTRIDGQHRATGAPLEVALDGGVLVDGLLHRGQRELQHALAQGFAHGAADDVAAPQAEFELGVAVGGHDAQRAGFDDE